MIKWTLATLVLVFSTTAAAQSACFALFEAAPSGTSAEPPKKVEVVKNDETKLKLERDAQKIREVFEMSEVEMDGLINIARKEFGDSNMSRQDVLHKLYEEKRKFDASIDGQLHWFGASLSKAVRDMRKRRQEFQMALLQGDALIAANMYRSLYESYGVSLSLLVNYARGNKATRDTELREHTSRYLLNGLTADKQYADIRTIVDSIYKNGRTPENAEILDVLDRVLSRSSDEFRYIEYHLKSLETSNETPESVLENVKYIRSRLSVDSLAAKFRFKLLKDAEIRSGSAASAIADSRPQILVYWLKRVSQLQKQHSRRLRLRSVFHVEALQKLITRLPISVRGAVLALARIDYNTYVIDRHIESIEAVYLAQKDVRLQVFLGKVGQGDKYKSAQYLETMARLASDMDTWNDLKVQVTAGAKTHANYKELLAQMEAAEKLIPKLGFISKLNSPSMHDHLVGWVMPGMAGVGTLVYTNWDTVVQGYTYLLTLVGL